MFPATIAKGTRADCFQIRRYTYDMSNGSKTGDCSPDAEQSHCALCEAALTAGVGYVVRIDIFADPAWSDSAGENADIKDSLAEAIDQAVSMSADELQDGVHRRFEYPICSRCHPKMLANPLGLPRYRRDAAN
jgi:hypothetical protein